MHIANTLTLPFYLLPFYLLRERTEDLEEGNSHFGYREEVLHIANPLTLPFYLLPFYLLRTGRTWMRETHISVTGREEHCTLQIA